MQYLLEILRNHAPTLILIVAFLETLGVPLPTFPFLVLTGCLIVEDSLFWPPIIAAAVIGALAGDQFWYWLGRRTGKRALNLLCRFTLNPDACMDRSQTLFHHSSVALIFFAKLVPGVNALVPPLSGIMGISPLRYVLLDAVGCFIWVGAGLGLGLFFGRSVLSHLAGVQYTLLILVILMFGFYVVFRIAYRYYLIKLYAIPRIDAETLQQEISSDDAPVVLDLRNERDYLESGRILPGARRISPRDFQTLAGLLPREKKIILYCT
jgi:membrane protein DedA with SNARE-associated domain